jgi:hypothetical protein
VARERQNRFGLAALGALSHRRAHSVPLQDRLNTRKKHGGWVFSMRTAAANGNLCERGTQRACVAVGVWVEGG